MPNQTFLLDYQTIKKLRNCARLPDPGKANSCLKVLNKFEIPLEPSSRGTRDYSSFLIICATAILIVAVIGCLSKLSAGRKQAPQATPSPTSLLDDVEATPSAPTTCTPSL